MYSADCPSAVINCATSACVEMNGRAELVTNLLRLKIVRDFNQVLPQGVGVFGYTLGVFH